MKRNDFYINKVLRKLAVCSLMLFAFVGSASAQNDPLHVIKKGEHYLAHVGVYDPENDTTIWGLQDADTFDPTTCLWYSGNTANVYGLHHNYYFIDGYGNYRFLAAPLQASGQLTLSATLPSIQLLRNTDQIYYFYDWDSDTYGAGVARGHKHAGINSADDCQYSWSDQDNECWEVYWVEYDNGTWELSAASSYNIPSNGARYRSVSVTEHEEEISDITAGLLPDLDDFSMDHGDATYLGITIPNTVTAGSYTPAYTTYVFEGDEHNFYGGEDHGNVPPSMMTTYTGTKESSEWTISGEGAFYLSFDGDDHYTSSTLDNPTIYYFRSNSTRHYTATLTLTVTYIDSEGQLSTQVRTATILLRAECGNPGQSADPVVTYEGVTVSWYPTAEQYRVYLSTNPDTWTEYYEVGDVTSYTFTGLDPLTQYYYKVVAHCDDGWHGIDDAPTFSFVSKGEAGLLVYGAVFGGGRMGDVVGKTEVAIINCDSIHAVYGGNDIAQTVFGNNGVNGATITIGVEEDDPNDFDDYGTTNAPIRIGDVYGGGNGYYAYNGTSFEPASYNTVYIIAPEASILDLTIDQQLGDTVYTNADSKNDTLVSPTIPKATITVTNDYVKIDSVFGGAKNAILNATSDDVSINIHGGTIFAVFGGNNYGGSLGYQSQERILVTNTSTQTGTNYHNGVLGRDFGIGYLFGGGNKVQGQHAYITIEGGQCDTVFGGGNEADVRSTEVRVQCALGAFADGAYGQVYTDALNSNYSSGDLTDANINGNYPWDRSGIYNVRTLFGGNNRASMEGVPSLFLTSGGIGTVYGGGNEGDMLAQAETTLVLPNTYGSAPVSLNVKYGTHVQMNSPNILVDFLYGGCQKSNVDYSTWTEIMDGHVGTVYGGCNISGDVGSTRVNPNAPSNPPSEEYQEVQGSTYVMASGGVVHNNLFGGSNGFYHCNDGINYVAGVTYCPPENYVGWAIPTHNETHVIVTGNAMIKKNVYAGGNMSPVGFTDATVGNRSFPQFVGLASVRMNGGEVVGNVFGGGNMASILGGNEVIVSGGSIGMTNEYDGALYGGNDRSGQAGQISNRVFPQGHDLASDGYTSLTDINTYVSVTGKPFINTVYGGGNGDYDYVNGDDVIPGGQYCSYDVSGEFNDKPIQTNTFVDINITGDNEQTGGHINTVYGGGNGVTVYGSITVFLNVKDAVPYDHVGTIFGGNNKDNVVEFENVPLVPDIILLHGQVGTVYGGCNKGAMTTGKDFNIGGNIYRNVGSMVRLRSSYPTPTGTVTPDAVVSNAVYGGCRMNDVYHNSLVLVEGCVPIPANLFGGCDISGAVNDTSLVVVTGGHVNGNIYAGGNGNYIYGEGSDAGNVYLGDDLVATENTNLPPTSRVSRIDLLGGQVGADASHISEVFGGGFGQLTNTTGDVIVNVGPFIASAWTGLPVIYGNVYGGSAFGSVNFNTDNVASTTSVSFFNGTLHGNLFGGGLGRKADEQTGVSAIEAKVFGKVFVTISTEDQAENNCFIDLRDADIYGCNNQNGSPQDEVRVDVWKTAFNFSDYQSGDIYTASYTESDASYAIDEVFGGGNQADYVPAGGENSTNRTKVYVHNCLNTIRRVFSGGNAAAAIGVVDTIQGGRMDYVFGGGNGEVTAANIGNGGTHLIVMGGTINSLFGGSNNSGDIAGQMYTEVNNESGCAEYIAEFYGGCNLAPLSTNSGVYSIIKCGAGTIAEAYGGSKLADIEGNVTFDVRGGTITNVFGGSKGQAGDTPDDAADIDGNVTLNLEGGEISNAFGGTNINGAITGSITVNVIDFEGTCGLDLTNVYGGGNLTPYTPSSTTQGPVVNVMHIAQDEGIKGNVFGGAYGASATVTANPIVNIGYDASTMSAYLDAITDLPEEIVPENFRVNVKGTSDGTGGNVFGGGDFAPVVGNTRINVYHGEVTRKLVGGGNEADINGNTNIYVMGGHIGTDGNATTGWGKGIYGGCNVDGTVSGNVLVELIAGTVGVSNTGSNINTANIHGGGYGRLTEVTGNVTVNFGDNTNEENTNIILYGDLYGGSALGNVNTADSGNPGSTTTTTVNLRNGKIVGAAYGGGLGQKIGVNGATENILAYVYGKVYVKVGDATNPEDFETFTGQANLEECSVYGCNNLNGSPLSDVFVDVYQTAHDQYNTQSNHSANATYAIDQVFGGGNQANYLVEGKKDNVYIHGCENTIRRTFGGGNAADVYGVDIHIDGGRFLIIFGGGNGELGEAYAANIGIGGIDLQLGGGRIGTLVNGSNMWGSSSGPISSGTYDSGCGELEVTDYFLGSNQSDIFADINVTISCIDASSWRYENLYCGSNLSQIYGNINVTIGGGTFDNVFGGSKGRVASGSQEAFASNIYCVTQEIINAFPEHPELKLGHGGNVSLTINGGVIGSLFGACDQNGNIDGKVSIVVEEHGDCPLFIGDIYGGGNLTSYVPTVEAFLPTNPNAIPTPNICILKAHIGGHNDVIGDYNGNVFGGGNRGMVTASPKVIIGKGIGIANPPEVVILGNVYGGGNEGDVNGSADVVVMPETHNLTYTSTYSQGTTITGGVYVYDGTGATLPASGSTIGEGIDLRIKAIASVYGWGFNGWTANNGTIVYPNDVNTLFTMGTDNASIAAEFISVDTRSFSYTQPANGTVTVTDGFGVTVPSPSSISIGAELNIVATPAAGYRFVRWIVTGNGYVTNPDLSSTIFTMGTETCTLTAEIELIPSYAFYFTDPEHGSIAVTTSGGETVNSGDLVREGTVLNIVAMPDEGYRFKKWTLTEGSGIIANSTESTTTFTIGTSSATITAEFEEITEP